MALELIIVASFLALAHGSSEVPPVATAPASPITYIKYSDQDQNSSKTEASAQMHADPVVLAAYDFHKTFLDKLSVKPPYHYSYGFECYNWRKKISLSQYEARYGDVAIGTHVLRGADGGSTTVHYTVDSSAGFYGVVHRDFQGQPSELGYARLAGALAFVSRPTPRGNPLADPGTNPLVIAAVYSHDFFVKYLNLEAPFMYSLGYELKNSETGITRSQYETYYGEEGEGSFTQVEANDTKNSIDYRIRPQGFAFVTSTRTNVYDIVPLVYTTQLRHSNLYV